MRALLPREFRFVAPALIAALLCSGLAACSGGEQVVDTSAPEPTTADASSTPEIPFPTAEPSQVPAGAPEIVTVPQADAPAQADAPKPGIAAEAAKPVVDVPAPAPEQAAPAQAAAEAAKPADPAASQDYYTRRANEILKEDAKNNAIKPHPLAAAYPDYFVTVCEAGCTDERAPEIVGMERKVTRETATRGMMVPTSSGGAAPEAGTGQAPEILCIGGCYGLPKAYPARGVPLPAAEKTAAAKAPIKRDPLSPIR